MQDFIGARRNLHSGVFEMGKGDFSDKDEMGVLLWISGTDYPLRLPAQGENGLPSDFPSFSRRGSKKFFQGP